MPIIEVRACCGLQLIPNKQRPGDLLHSSPHGDCGHAAALGLVDGADLPCVVSRRLGRHLGPRFGLAVSGRSRSLLLPLSIGVAWTCSCPLCLMLLQQNSLDQLFETCWLKEGSTEQVQRNADTQRKQESCAERPIRLDRSGPKMAPSRRRARTG